MDAAPEKKRRFFYHEYNSLFNVR